MKLWLACVVHIVFCTHYKNYEGKISVSYKLSQKNENEGKRWETIHPHTRTNTAQAHLNRQKPRSDKQNKSLYFLFLFFSGAEKWTVKRPFFERGGSQGSVCPALKSIFAKEEGAKNENVQNGECLFHLLKTQIRRKIYFREKEFLQKHKNTKIKKQQQGAFRDAFIPSTSFSHRWQCH